MSQGNGSSSIFSTIITVIVICVIGGGGAYGYFMYQKHKAVVKEKIEALPTFNEAEETKAVASEFKIKLPLKIPEKNLEATLAQIQKTAEKSAAEKFTSKDISKKQMDLLKKYSTAKADEEVDVYVESNAGKRTRVHGLFKGKKSEANGVFVKIGDEIVDYKRILPEYQYLFDDKLSALTQEQELAKFRKEHEAEKKEYIDKLKREMENSGLREAGFIRNADDEWIPEEDFVKKELEKRKKAMLKKRISQVERILEENKFLGVISMTDESTPGK